jgi:glucan phosphoethanolaminetransferase (alkaline phosphatase superfamily)
VIALALASVLFLYRHIFYPSHIRYTSLVLAAVCFAWCTAALVIEIGFPGHTIAYFFPGASTTTFNVTYLTFWLAMGIIETLLEIIILLLPLREIARLQLSRRKKYLLSIIFSLGGFVVITAIIRLSILYRPTKPDLDLTKGDIWFNVHLGTGIISACLPTFRPLISRSSSFLQSFSSRKGSYTTDQSESALDNMKSRLREANEHGKSETEGIVMQPKKDNLQGSYADARWSEGSNSPSGAWQEDGAVTAGEAIAVRRTVEVV